MIYDLSNALQRESFKIRCNNLYKKGGIIELIDKKVRTIKQNSYLHLILSYFGCESGNTLEYVKSEYYKILVNPELFIIEKDDPYLGKITILKSSKDLTKDEMTLSIERFRNWSAQTAGIFLPDAENPDMIRQMEIEVERNNRFI
jgi:hypothetical protein